MQDSEFVEWYSVRILCKYLILMLLFFLQMKILDIAGKFSCQLLIVEGRVRSQNAVCDICVGQHDNLCFLCHFPTKKFVSIYEPVSTLLNTELGASASFFLENKAKVRNDIANEDPSKVQRLCLVLRSVRLSFNQALRISLKYKTVQLLMSVLF